MHFETCVGAPKLQLMQGRWHQGKARVVCNHAEPAVLTVQQTLLTVTMADSGTPAPSSANSSSSLSSSISSPSAEVIGNETERQRQ